MDLSSSVAEGSNGTGPAQPQMSQLAARLSCMQGPEVHSQAAGEIAQLAAIGSQCNGIVSTATIVRRLTMLLGCHSYPQVQEAAAHAVEQLVVNSSERAEVAAAQPGMLQHLVALTASATSEPAQLSALITLKALAGSPAVAENLIQTADCVKNTLRAAMARQSSMCCSRAHALLAQLQRQLPHQAFFDAIARQQAAVDELVAMVQPDQPAHGKALAVALLTGLYSQPFGRQAVSLAPQAVTWLIHLMQTSEEQGPRKADVLLLLQAIASYGNVSARDFTHAIFLELEEPPQVHAPHQALADSGLRRDASVRTAAQNLGLAAAGLGMVAVASLFSIIGTASVLNR